jgi:tripartite-type tricarboxylate transporter receptor subunit TctC
MPLQRRQFLQLGVSVASLRTLSHVAQVETYPARPVHLIVGFPPGGGNDIVARLMGQCLSERLGQPFVIENRPGAASNIATEVVVRALPDGYTLLLTESSDAINATLYDNLNFNFLRDIAPVAGIIRVPNILLVHSSIPTNTVSEFIAYAKANPGKLAMASPGIGSVSHLSGELFKVMTGINMLHVPYRGLAPALTALLGGQVQVIFASMPGSIEYIKAGKLRALAITTATRSAALPELAAINEFVPGYEASLSYGVGAPHNMPAEIVEKLNKQINSSLIDPKVKARFADLGGTPLTGSPTGYGKLIADEAEKWGKVIRAANIKPE